MKNALLLLGLIFILSGCKTQQVVQTTPTPPPQAVVEGVTLNDDEPAVPSDLQNEQQKLEESVEKLVKQFESQQSNLLSSQPRIDIKEKSNVKDAKQTKETITQEPASPSPQASITPQPPASEPSPSQQPSEANTQTSERTVTISITDNEGNKILSPTNIEFAQGDTLLDVLIKTGKEKGISVVYSGGKSNGYVKGINNLFEFDKGAESGWMFKINGKFGEKSSGGYKANQGDVIEWIYTTKMGRDIGQTGY